MSSLDESDAHRARKYLDLAEKGETSGSTDQGPGGPTASDGREPSTSSDADPGPSDEQQDGPAAD